MRLASSLAGRKRSSLAIGINRSYGFAGAVEGADFACAADFAECKTVTGFLSRSTKGFKYRAGKSPLARVYERIWSSEGWIKMQRRFKSVFCVSVKRSLYWSMMDFQRDSASA